jgi:hypothetical protein
MCNISLITEMNNQFSTQCQKYFFHCQFRVKLLLILYILLLFSRLFYIAINIADNTALNGKIADEW